MRLDLILLMKDIYINYNLNPLTKFTISSRNTEIKDILPWKYLSNDHKDCSQWRESHGRTKNKVRKRKEIQKSRTLRVTVREPSRKANHLSKVI